MQLHYPLNPTTGLEDQSQLPWSDGVPQTGQEGSYPPHAMCVEPMTELVNLETVAGLVPTSGDLFQVTRAVRGGQLDYAADTGTADALSTSFALAHTAIKAGLPFTVLKGAASNATTTPSLTVTGPNGANAITAPLVRRDGSALAAGDLPGGAMFQVRGDAAGNLRVLTPVASDVNLNLRRLPILRTGANRSFLFGDNGFIIRRSNGGFAMQDQLPTLAQVGAGWSTTIRNSDASAQLTLTTTTSINGLGQISVPPDTDVTVAIDASGAWFTSGQPGRAVFSRTGANQPFTELDRGCLILRSNAGGNMQDSPPGATAGALPNGWYCSVRNIDNAPLVIAPTVGSTINGASSVTIPAGGDAHLFCDGTNYWCLSTPTITAAQFTAPKSYIVLASLTGKVAYQWGSVSGIAAGGQSSITLLLAYSTTGYSLSTSVLGGSGAGAAVSGTANTTGSIIVTNTGTGALAASWFAIGAL